MHVRHKVDTFSGPKKYQRKVDTFSGPKKYQRKVDTFSGPKKYQRQVDTEILLHISKHSVEYRQIAQNRQRPPLARGK